MSTIDGARPLSHLAEDYQGPLPASELETAFYWEALSRHELRILRCDDCGRYVHYPLACCPSCHSFDLTPTLVSGDATLYSFTDVHHGFVPGIEPPYLVGLVELVEQPGLRLLSNIVDVDVADVRIGMALRPVFVEVASGVTLLYFTREADDE
jgi:uncharacterized OB-fold protein